MSIDNMATIELKHLLKDCRRRNARIRADTIEECARVAENHWPNNTVSDSFAAAIRGLKDKP